MPKAFFEAPGGILELARSPEAPNGHRIDIERLCRGGVGTVFDTTLAFALVQEGRVFRARVLGFGHDSTTLSGSGWVLRQSPYLCPLADVATVI
jgi:hypothetical protein